jgi:hypothetical protein
MMLSAASEVAWAMLVGHRCDFATNSGSHLEDDEEPRKPAPPASSGAKRPAWIRMGQAKVLCADLPACPRQ